MTARLKMIRKVKLEYRTLAPALIPYTALPNKWEGGTVAIVPYYEDGYLSKGLQDQLSDLQARHERDLKEADLTEAGLRGLLAEYAAAVRQVISELDLDAGEDDVEDAGDGVEQAGAPDLERGVELEQGPR